MPVTLEQASIIVDAAIAHRRENGVAPLSVAVLDPGGHLVAFKREDHTGILRFDVAFGKAYGALGLGFGSRELATRAPKRPEFFSAMIQASGGRMIPGPGGVLIVSDNDVIIGAVGISGDDSSDKDESCAVAGIRAAGLEPKVGLID